MISDATQTAGNAGKRGRALTKMTVLTEEERAQRDALGDTLSRMVLTMTDEQRSTLLCKIIGGIMGRYSGGGPESEIMDMINLAVDVKCGAKGK